MISVQNNERPRNDMFQESIVDLKAFAQALTQYRGEASIGKFAPTLGVSKTTLSMLERGTSPSLDTYVRACRKMGVPLDTFIKSE